jgi:acetolactate synthase-1/2/3 large subunit
LKPQRLIHELRDAMPDDAMLFVDNGSAILWGNYYFQVRRPDTYFVDLGLNAMGSAVAGVVGGVMAAPHRRAVALVGDGAFAMHGFEIHTAIEERLPIVWVVLNNAGYGMVRQGEKLRQAEDLGVSRFRVPLDIATIAQGLGARGVRVQTAADFRHALDEALASAEPWVIDAVIDVNEMAPTLERRVQRLVPDPVPRTATSCESS